MTFKIVCSSLETTGYGPSFSKGENPFDIIRLHFILPQVYFLTSESISNIYQNHTKKCNKMQASHNRNCNFILACHLHRSWILFPAYWCVKVWIIVV